MPPRTPSLPLASRHHGTKREPGPTYFFKDSPFFEIRELVLSNMSLDGLSAAPTRSISELTQNSLPNSP
jgi:E3 SUMO-protein ligase PIAS1